MKPDITAAVAPCHYTRNKNVPIKSYQMNNPFHVLSLSLSPGTAAEQQNAEGVASLEAP